MRNKNLYNGDFQKYFDTGCKRNYWLMGYFGGGAVNVVDAMQVAKDFARAINVPLESIRIDEVHYSNWCKGFKYFFSDAPNQAPDGKAKSMENVFGYLYTT